MYTLGNATVEGLRRLLEGLGALPQAGGAEAAAGTPGGAPGRRHVVITDLREELVLYVNGTAYMRRELEMPAAALHHAGAWSGETWPGCCQRNPGLDRRGVLAPGLHFFSPRQWLLVCKRATRGRFAPVAITATAQNTSPAPQLVAPTSQPLQASRR